MTEKHASEKLVTAYERMMERMRHGLELAEQKTAPAFEQALSHARETAIALGELTRDEAEKVGAYLKRDLQDMAEYLEDTGEELGSWFHIDLELIEARLLDLIGSVADQTRVELAQLRERARSADLYHSGEVTGPGALRCTACGQLIHLKRTAHIPPCPKCHAGGFERVRGPET
jgi:hypothetical protein